MVDLPTILSSGIAAAAFSAAFNTFSQRFLEDRRSKPLRYFAAIKVANIFDKFAVNCSRRIAEIEIEKDSRGAAGKRYYSLPKLEDFPSDIHINLLAGDVLAAIDNLTLEIAVFNDGREVMFVILDEDQFLDEAFEALHKVGTKALNLANKIRASVQAPRLSFMEEYYEDLKYDEGENE